MTDRRAPYTPAQLADIARRGRADGWRCVEVTMHAGEFRIRFLDEVVQSEPSLDDELRAAGGGVWEDGQGGHQRRP